MSEQSDSADTTPAEDSGAAATPSNPSVPPPPPPAVKLSKAEKLEAKAARLREAEAAARERAEATGPAPGQPLPALRLALAGWPLVVAAVLVLALVAAVVWLSVRLTQTNSKLDTAHRLDATRASALKTARTYAIDFATYDYAHLAEDSKRVVSHLTPAFAKQYSSVSKQLSSLIVQYKGKETAKVQGIGVASVSQKQAVVVVFLDQTVTTSQSTTPRINRYRMNMTMQRQPDGSWLISNMTLA